MDKSLGKQMSSVLIAEHKELTKLAKKCSEHWKTLTENPHQLFESMKELNEFFDKRENKNAPE